MSQVASHDLLRRILWATIIDSLSVASVDLIRAESQHMQGRHTVHEFILRPIMFLVASGTKTDTVRIGNTANHARCITTPVYLVGFFRIATCTVLIGAASIRIVLIANAIKTHINVVADVVLWLATTRTNACIAT